ncbi:hypothetical protein VI817_006261 [Penicillium citrinum]|nr:hypothetical protein VI817_006261 [Penicillium citrinum]
MHNRPPARIGVPPSKSAQSAQSRPAAPLSHTGRLGTRAIIAPVAWEMMDVSDPRTPSLRPALLSSDWRAS